MKKIILLAAVGLLATNAMAMSRLDAKSVTCAQVHDKIAQDGAVVLQWPSKNNPSLTMYDRFVSNSMACKGQGAMASAKVATSDNAACPVKTCNNVTGKGPNKNH